MFPCCLIAHLSYGNSHSLSLVLDKDTVFGPSDRVRSQFHLSLH